MLLKVAMIRGDDKRRTTECSPTDQGSAPTLKPIYPFTKWLDGLTFDTTKFELIASGEPIRDNITISLPPVPYAQLAGDYSLFELQDHTGKYIGTSMRQPIASVSLPNSELDPEIISERRPIYLAVAPAKKPDVITITCEPDEPPVAIIDTPEAMPVDTTVVECPPVETTPDDDEPVTITDYVDNDEDDPVVVIDDLTDQELATKYLRFFLQHHVQFFKGRKLTSSQLRAAIEANAPTNVHIDLLAGRALTNEFTAYFGTGMEKRGTRIDGDVKRFWRDFQVHIHRPDPLERSWYDQ